MSILVPVYRGPWPTMHCQSVCPVPSPSILTTQRSRCYHQMPKSLSIKTVAGVIAPLGQSTEIQSRCSLALGGIVKTDNRIYKFDIRIWEKSDIIIDNREDGMWGGELASATATAVAKPSTAYTESSIPIS